MVKKITALLLCVLMLTAVGCNKKKKEDTESSAPSEVESQIAAPSILNPLTGVADISADKATTRPVAVMVNNISIAQPVQTGLTKADIVYETEVEGGITRLMAVYQDISKVERIGTVRSARYVYIDLAMGHNAIYVHHGQDPNYAKPHLKDTDDFTVSEGNYGVRTKNGLASEHTLYAYGDKLWNGLVKDGWKTENKSSAPWQTFADENAPVSFANPCSSVSVPFSTSCKTTFNYDAASGKYIRYFNGTLRTDYLTGESEQFKNVFVLMTTIKSYPIAKYRNISLDSGDGYYCVNGTYTPIKWSKGSASSSFKFTNVDGTPLTVNPGNSWVCIASSSTSQPAFS